MLIIFTKKNRNCKLKILAKMKIKYRFLYLIFISIILIGAWKQTDPKYVNWAEYLGGADRNHYSELTQINAENVSNLKIAWTYSLPDSGQMQTNPLIIDGVLYGVSARVEAFALDAATGKQIWKFTEKLNNWASTSRGVAYWADGENKQIMHTIGPYLYALDARTGEKINSFGVNGRVDLHEGLPESAKEKFIISNTPGTIFGDLIVMPVRLSEGSDAAPGDIRAFNVRTGKLAWSFHTIPYPGEYGYETFPKDAYKNKNIGAANNWAGMAIDRKRGIIYVPTGSAAYDFYGGNRAGKNLFANCLIAINATTGKRIWHYQTIHHDIWDRDHPATPNLITLKHNGKMVDAVAQVTKQGYVFVFDRVTGKPLFPIVELPAPKSDLEGEQAWPTQPTPSKPLPYARQAYQLADDDISIYAENRTELLAAFKKYKRQQFAPPSREGTVILPGYDGGAEWGGAAVDPEGIMYVNSNEMAWILNMVNTPKPSELSALPLGERTYKVTCSQCHGAELKGNPKSNYPSLVNIGKKLDRQAIATMINNGKGMMPGYNFLKADEKLALTEFLLGLEKKEVSAKFDSLKANYLPFMGTGYNKFLDAKGHPAISPPWGTLNAINLNTGDYLWKIPFGNEPNLPQKGTGTENYGGPVITASGLLFIAATKDGQFRAFEKRTGKLLWETTLPFAAFATPATYAINGKQYIVLACGGTKLGTPKGNQYVAYALP
jgi:quinoprotein glucose dehydrogenase